LVGIKDTTKGVGLFGANLISFIVNLKEVHVEYSFSFFIYIYINISVIFLILYNLNIFTNYFNVPLLHGE